jgi:RNA recognition motif-containing protein
MRTVMVMQLPRNCRPADLIEHFTKAGKVRDAKLIADRNSRRSKGIAYVEFCEPDSVPNALAMNGERLGPAPLIIMMTQSEKNRQAALKEKEAAAGGPCRVSVANLPFEITSASLKVTMVPSPCLIQDACVSVWVDGWVCMFPLFCHVYACPRVCVRTNVDSRMRDGVFTSRFCSNRSPRRLGIPESSLPRSSQTRQGEGLPALGTHIMPMPRR